MKNYFKLILIAVGLFCVSFVNFEKKEITVVIDAGHGGDDFGAKNDTHTEKVLTESILRKIESLHKESNIKLYFTRKEDKNVSLEERAIFINQIKPDIAISLHVNQNSNETTNGYEIFVSEQSIVYDQSKKLAKQLIDQFSEASPLHNRGLKTGPFMLLKKAEYPTMILEMGFISNPNDRNYLVSEKGQNEIAQTILDFVSQLN